MEMKTYTKCFITFMTVVLVFMNGFAQNPLAASVINNAASTQTPTKQSDRSLQLNNNLPIVRISPRTSQKLADNHIGAWFEDYGRFYDTDFVYRNGFKQIRIGSLAGKGQRWATVINSESLSAEVDKTISEYADNGVKIVLILMSGSGVNFHFNEYDTTFKSDEDINTYLKFVSFVVQHFKGRIPCYEILNEPGFISVATYANLIKKVVPVIRKEDPAAKIIIGAIPGSWENGFPGYGDYQRFKLYTDYLNDLLRAGVVDLVDGISWHPFYENVPSDPYYQDYPQIVQSSKDLAFSQGFKGEYFADEILWSTSTVDDPNWDNGPPVSEGIAVKYFTRAITEHRGLDINVTINTFFQKTLLSPIQNINDVLAGAMPVDMKLSLDPPIKGNTVRSYAFALPNGDRLVALWTNGIAVEKDIGIKTTLTFHGLSASKVIGIDVLNGFEQELITEIKNGNLLIHDLLVRDYPLIIRFVSPLKISQVTQKTPTPTPKPKVVEIKWDCDAKPASPIAVSRRDSIQPYIRWAAKTSDQLNDYMAAIQGSIYVDGVLIRSRISQGKITKLEGTDMVVVQTNFDAGLLSPGTHKIRTLLTFTRQITDGSDWYGPGTKNESIDGTCTVKVNS